MKLFPTLVPNAVFLSSIAVLPLAAQEVTELDEVLVADTFEEVATLDEGGGTTNTIDGEEFSLWNASSLRDVPARVPNFFTTDTGTNGYGDIMTIRGVGNTPFFSGPGVVYYVDGVPLGDVFSYSDSFVDVETVEVNRGPQGARYGRSAYAGAVNITTKRPENEWGGSMTVGGGSYNQFGTSGSLSGALIDDVLKFRFFGFHDERDGYISNNTLRKNTDDVSRSGGGGTIYWTPSDDWEISLSGSWETFDNGSTRIVPLGRFDLVGSNVEGQMQGDTTTAALWIAYDGDDFRFSSVTARRTWEIDPFVQDLDLSAFPVIFSRLRQDQAQWSEELRFSSPTDSDSALEWSTGVYGAFADTDHEGFNPFTGLTTYKQEQEDYAIFAEGGLQVSESLKALLGLRYDYVSKDMVRLNNFFAPFGTPFSGDWDYVTPSFTLELQTSENVLFYARTSYTSKPGGFSAFANFPPATALAEYDEETNWASEVGMKASGANGRLRGRAAAFYYDIDDYQVERVVGFAGDYFIINADDATSYGGELELGYDLFPGLTIDGSIGLTETELDNFTDPITGASLSGNEAPFVPEFDFVVGGTWQCDSGLFCRLEYRRVGDTHFTDTNMSRFRQQAYDLVNAQVGYRRDNYVFSVFGTNLTDEEYYTNANPGISAPAGGGAVGAPMEVGAKITIEF